MNAERNNNGWSIYDWRQEAPFDAVLLGVIEKREDHGEDFWHFIPSGYYLNRGQLDFLAHEIGCLNQGIEGVIIKGALKGEGDE